MNLLERYEKVLSRAGMGRLLALPESDKERLKNIKDLETKVVILESLFPPSKLNFLEIAKKYLAKEPVTSNGICLTIRYDDLDGCENPEKLIKERVETCYYKFSEVRDYTDSYGRQYLMFFNP